MSPAEPTRDDTKPDGEKAGLSSGSQQMDMRMMWVMMIGCCVAIPLALIIGGASLGGMAGVSPWLIGAGVLLAMALLITRRMSSGSDGSAAAPDEH